MRSRHIFEIDRFAVFTDTHLTVSCIVSKTVFDTNDNPSEAVSGSNQIVLRLIYHRFVKTTPKPRATKNSSGELVGPVLELLPPVDCDGDGTGEVEVAANDDVVVVVGVSARPSTPTALWTMVSISTTT